MQGIQSDLRFGVRRDSADLEVHAWVEHLGLPLNDSADVAERFKLVPLPPR